jgi:tetratricopeptide (TPR) repeat protein
MVCFAITLTAGAQKQGVYVRTLEKANRPSQSLEGVTVNILEYPNTLVSKKGGKLSFSIPGKKQGDSFKVSRVQKKGYTLVDKLLIGRKYSYSATVPIEIVMVSDKQLAQDKKRVEDKAYAKAKRTYETRIAELERKLNEKTISEQAFYAERKRLSDDYDSYVKLIGDMAERYAMTDYKGLSDINREILQCIENAELERADSLINSKGDFDKREQELRSQLELNQATAEFLAQSQRDAEVKLYDLAEDYYNKFTILSAKYQNDSAAYYLMRRAALDTTNLEWISDAGNFIRNYLADYALAMKYYQQGLRQAIAQNGEQSEWVGWYYNDIGLIYDFQGNYSQAIEYYQKSLSVCEQIFGDEHRSVANSYNYIGGIYLHQHDFDKAFEYLHKSLTIRERIFEANHSDIAESYNDIGDLYFDQGDYTQAMEYYQKSLAIRKQIFDAEDPDIAESYNSIAGVYYHQGDYAQAIEYTKKSLAIRELVFGMEHPAIAASYTNIGRIYVMMKDYSNALESFTKAHKIFLKAFGPDHEEVQKINTIFPFLNIMVGK